MDANLPLVIFIFIGLFFGLPILYLLLMLYWRLNPNHRPRWLNANREFQQRDSHGAWLFMGRGGGGGDSGGGGGGGGDSGGGGGPS
jgi:uncharacterized membrane protein YgcG